MEKKVFAWIAVVILSVAFHLNAGYFFLGGGYFSETGIKATLKPGCYVDYGMSFSRNGNKSSYHCPRCCAIDSNGNVVPREHFPVDKILIVDVYGDYCTIVCSCSGERYSSVTANDYPLSNLNYDANKVAKADDGVRCSNSSIKSGGLSIVLFVCLESGFALGIILLVRNVIRSGKDGLPEKKPFEERA